MNYINEPEAGAIYEPRVVKRTLGTQNDYYGSIIPII